MAMDTERVHPTFAAHLVQSGWSDPYAPAYWRVDVVDHYGRVMGSYEAARRNKDKEKHWH